MTPDTSQNHRLGPIVHEAEVTLKLLSHQFTGTPFSGSCAGAGWKLMGGEIETAVREVSAQGLLAIRLNMTGSIPGAADLVVSDPCRPA